MAYKKILSKFKRKYGATSKALSKQLCVAQATLTRWEKNGINIFEKAASLNFYRNGNNTKKTKKSLQKVSQ